MKWDELRESLQSISDADKTYYDLVARMVAEITQRRKTLGWTQQQLAKKADVLQPAIARMETGGTIPKLDTVFKVARALRMRVVLVPEESDESTLVPVR